MISIDSFSRIPIFIQISDGMKKEIMLSIKKAGDIIPSVRELSLNIGVNPNTVQKAYTELQREGILIPVQGKGNVISENAYRIIKEMEINETLSKLRENISLLSDLDFPKEQITDITCEIYGKKEKDND